MGERKQAGAEIGRRQQPSGEQGYMLLGAIVAVALVMIALGAAFTEEAFTLRREREEESVHRANQYVRAIREYYLKFQRYPGTVEQLESTNNVRFLRQRYVDPLTGKADYRLILLGQNKTTVKGFFGEPLAGLPGSGPGAGLGAGGSPTTATTNGVGASAAGSAFGASGAAGLGSGAGAAPGGGFSAGGFSAGGFGAAAAAGAGSAAAAAPGGSNTPAGQSAATDQPGTIGGGPGAVGPFIGVGSSATGKALITVNEQTNYEDWEFLYDPRIERLKAAGALNSGAGTAGGGGNPAGLGSGSSSGATGNGIGGTTGTSGGAQPAGGGLSTQP